MKTLPCWHVCNMQLFINTREKCGNELWTQRFLSFPAKVRGTYTGCLTFFLYSSNANYPSPRTRVHNHVTFSILTSFSVCFCLISSLFILSSNEMNPHLFFPSLQSVCAGIPEPLFPKHELTVISSKQNAVLVFNRNWNVSFEMIYCRSTNTSYADFGPFVPTWVPQNTV